MPTMVCEEHLNLHGCLAKAGIQGGRWTWQRYKVWLLRDRLCYAPLSNPGKSIHYIPLDRITIRPLPREYQPRIGVQHLDPTIIPLVDAKVGSAVPDSPIGQVFSVQYGAKTVYWAARTYQEAQAWIQAIRGAWVAAVMQPDRHMRLCKAALGTDASVWRSLRCTSAEDREDFEYLMRSAKARQGRYQEALCDVEGWAAGAKPWLALNGFYPGESSGRHLLIPVGSAAEAFTSAAVATCQISIPAGMSHSISFVELGLHGQCSLWAPEKVLIRQHGQIGWTEFPCESVLSNC